jgi:hypothetical protein
MERSDFAKHRFDTNPPPGVSVAFLWDTRRRFVFSRHLVLIIGRTKEQLGESCWLKEGDLNLAVQPVLQHPGVKHGPGQIGLRLSVAVRRIEF